MTYANQLRDRVCKPSGRELMGKPRPPPRHMRQTSQKTIGGKTPKPRPLVYTLVS